MTKKNYYVLGMVIAVLAPIGQIILSWNWIGYNQTKILIGIAIVVTILQMVCHYVIYNNEYRRKMAASIGVLLFFVFAFAFIIMDRIGGNGFIPSGSTIFLWIPQAWIFKTLADYKNKKF